MNIQSLNHPSKFGTPEAWILASRPKTLIAGISPVILGCALAWEANSFRFVPALICALFALIMQIGCNLANDYQDYANNVDTEDRKGPKRAVNEGLIAPEIMKYAAWSVLGFGFLLGLTLIFYGGWWLLAVGVLCVIGALAYSGGPYPLGYVGLGDLMVFIFFGLIAVMFTFYVQAGYFSTSSIFVAAGCGLLAANLRLVNDSRDKETDAKAGKKTFAVRFGLEYCFLQYSASYFVALLMPLFLLCLGHNFWVLLPYLSIVMGIPLMVAFKSAQSGDEYNKLLVNTAKLLLLYSVLFSIGIILS